MPRSNGAKADGGSQAPLRCESSPPTKLYVLTGGNVPHLLIPPNIWRTHDSVNQWTLATIMIARTSLLLLASFLMLVGCKERPRWPGQPYGHPSIPREQSARSDRQLDWCERTLINAQHEWPHAALR
ncbi:MAG TPA: hypothetical protein VFS47_15700 [Steroidobacteraceae bacterium]|jgi:hypothetical protein|nr:hypothetical protein [Steroidobacteraceae bacterium]